MKKLFFILLSASIFYSCNNNEKFQTHESGLEYKIIKSDNEDAKKLNLNDVIVLNMSYETSDGRPLFNSGNSSRKYIRTVLAPSHAGGSFEDGLLMLSEGDSAVFKVNAESFMLYSEKFSKLPKNIKYDDNIIIKLRVIEKLDREDYYDLVAKGYHTSREMEMSILEDYIKNANITVQPKESGLYYIEEEEGTGKKPELSDYVDVHYTVKLIDGELIETSLGKKPITFRMGAGQVIRGWDEGIAYMREGGKAMLIIPSDLAYGASGSGKILPYSTLIFHVELVNVK